MFDIIERLLRTEKGNNKAVFIGLCIIGLLLLDQFTSYPSIVFLKDKYETVETLQRLIDNPRTSPALKAEAANEITNLSDRRSIRQYERLIFERTIDLFANRRLLYSPFHLPLNYNLLDLFIFLFKWIAFLFIASGGYILNATGLGTKPEALTKSIDTKYIKLTKFKYYILAILSILFALVCANVFYNRSPIFVSFMSQLVFSFVMVLVLVSYQKLRKSKENPQQY